MSDDTTITKKENFTITFDRDKAATHEMDIQLLAVKGVFEKMGVSRYGRNVDVYIKVKGQFKAASFDIELLLWYTTTSTTIVPITLLGHLVGLIQLYKWARVSNHTNEFIGTNNEGQ